MSKALFFCPDAVTDNGKKQLIGNGFSDKRIIKKKEQEMEKFFKLKERGTSVKTEFIAGMTTFFAMVYILMVNANMFADPFGDGSNPLGVSYGAIYIATAISAVVGTILAGLLANLPLAQASGMGLNALFVAMLLLTH